MPRQREADKLVPAGDGYSLRHTARRLTMVVATLVMLLATTAGCSSNSSSGTSAGSTPATSASSVEVGSSTASSYPAGKEQVCRARDQLETSIDALTNPSLLLGGTTAIKSAVDQVQTDLTALGAAAKDDYKPQVSDMQTSLTQLQTAVGGLGDGDVTANLPTVGTAIASVGAAGASLFTQLKAACGS